MGSKEKIIKLFSLNKQTDERTATNGSIAASANKRQRKDKLKTNTEIYNEERKKNKRGK